MNRSWTDDEMMRQMMFKDIPHHKEMLEKALRCSSPLMSVILSADQIVVSDEIIRQSHVGRSLESLQGEVVECADVLSAYEPVLAKNVRALKLDAEGKFDPTRVMRRMAESLFSDTRPEASEALKRLTRHLRERDFQTTQFGHYDPKNHIITIYTEAIRGWCERHQLKEFEVVPYVFANMCFRAHVHEAAKQMKVQIRSKKQEAAIDAMAAYYVNCLCRREMTLEYNTVCQLSWERHCSEAWPESLALPMLKFDKGTCDTLRSAYGRLMLGEDAYALVQACKEIWEM